MEIRQQTIGWKPATSFQAYVRQLRQCDLNIRLLDKQKRHQASHQASDNGYSTDQSGTSSGSAKRSYHGANQLSEEVLDQLRLEGKCFRCQQPGHMAMDLHTPCRGRRGRKMTTSGQGIGQTHTQVPGLSKNTSPAALMGKNPENPGNAMVRFSGASDQWG